MFIGSYKQVKGFQGSNVFKHVLDGHHKNKI